MAQMMRKGSSSTPEQEKTCTDSFGLPVMGVNIRNKDVVIYERETIEYGSGIHIDSIFGFWTIDDNEDSVWNELTEQEIISLKLRK